MIKLTSVFVLHRKSANETLAAYKAAAANSGSSTTPPGVEGGLILPVGAAVAGSSSSGSGSNGSGSSGGGSSGSGSSGSGSSSSNTSNISSSGLSQATKIAIGVAIPVIFLAFIAGIFLGFRARGLRHLRRHVHEVPDKPELDNRAATGQHEQGGEERPARGAELGGEARPAGRVELGEEKRLVGGVELGVEERSVGRVELGGEERPAGVVVYEAECTARHRDS